MDFGWNLTKNNPAPELKLLMEDLETSIWAFQEYLPKRIGTSHGGLRHFGSELTKNTPTPRIETSHGGLMYFSSELTKNTPPPHPLLELELLMEGYTGDWCGETNTVSPADTISFSEFKALRDVVTCVDLDYVVNLVWKNVANLISYTRRKSRIWLHLNITNHIMTSALSIFHKSNPL